MAKPNLNPIQWYEGMLLMPQHFQQTDVRVESLIAYYLQNSFPYFWGVLNLKVDEALLTSGTFRPIELEAIMPDGLTISALPETQTALEVNLRPIRNQLQQAPQFIYLCIPPQKIHETPQKGEVPRYISALSSQVIDMNTGEQPVDIPLLEPNISLHVGSEPPPHYVTLPIAQVTYDTKSFSLTHYLPPQPQIDLSSGVGALCNELSERLRLKLGYLQQRVQTVEEKAIKGTFFQEIEDIRLKLVAGLLPYNAILSSKGVSPLLLFREICSLAGLISGVKYGEIPPSFHGYDHLDLRRTFSQVIDYIQKILDEIQESYTVIPFTLKDRLFSLQLQSAWVRDRLILGATAQAGMETEDLTRWINNCVIVTDKNIILARDNRVLGAERTIVSEVPVLNLVATSGVQLFVVELDPRYIDPKGILCIFNISDDEATRPTQVVLYNSKENLQEKKIN